MNDLLAPAAGRASVETEGLLADFTDYLCHERALAPTTVTNYLNQVRPFAVWYAAARTTPLTTLRIQDVNDFLRWRARSCSTGSIMVAATALRALLRWMFLTGLVDQQLASAVGPVRYLAHSGLPKALGAAQVAALLECEMSQRDRAVVLVLARLGLRSREVAELRLEDIDWRAGEVLVPGKGNDQQLMPLPAEVGHAVAAYLRQGRDQSSSHRELFLGSRPVQLPLSRTGVSCIVTRLARRAGLTGRVGAHRLRHSAATAVLAGGGTLTEAGQLLRHRSTAATSIYAKVTPEGLVTLVRPWPASIGTLSGREQG